MIDHRFPRHAASASPAVWLSSLAAHRLAPCRRQRPRPHFYDDDPIAREPESQDASKAQPYEIGDSTRWPTTCS